MAADPTTVEIARRQPGWLLDLALVAAAVGLVGAVTALALHQLTIGVPDPTVHELVIEPGDARRIAAGENPLEIPVSWSLYDGDTLVLVNRDLQGHSLGPWAVAPGATIEVPLVAELGGSLFCSLHPSGTLDLDVRPRSVTAALTLWPALLLGLPLGGVAVLVRRSMHLLREDRAGETGTR